MHKFKSILLGSVIGLAIGVSLSTFLFDNLFKSIFPKIYISSFAFDSYVTSIPIIIFLLVLGGIVGWIISTLKKETAPSPQLSKGVWILSISVAIILIGFYAFSFTTTYECEVRTKGNIQLKDACYSKKLICEKISGPKISDSCYYNLAEYNMDSQICNKIINNNDLNNCLALVAVRKSKNSGQLNTEYCEQLSEQEKRDWCYAKLDSWKDTSICEKIFGQTEKNECYHSAATKLCDKSLCEKIINGPYLDLKSNCLETVERDKDNEHRPGGSCDFFQQKREELLKSNN